MTHTVTRLLPEAFERLAAIKAKYPDMKHTALVGELLKDLPLLITLRALQRVLRPSESQRANWNYSKHSPQ